MTVEAAPTASPAPAASQPTTAAAPPPKEGAPPPKAEPGREERLAALRAAKGLNGSTAASTADATSPQGSTTSAPLAGAESNAGSAAEPASKDSATADPLEGDSKLALRLARIAKEKEAVRARDAKLKEREGDLAKFDAFKAARTAGKRIDALKALFDEGEITTDLFNELTDHVLASEPAKPQTEDDKIKAKVDEALTAKEKAAEEAAQNRRKEIQETYTGAVAKVFEGEAKRWPLIASRGVEAGDIHSYVEAEFKRSGQVPSPEAVLDHFQRSYEADLEAAGYTRKVEAAQGGQRPTSETVNPQWTRDRGAPEATVDESKMSLRESREAIKRRFFDRPRS